MLLVLSFEVIFCNVSGVMYLVVERILWNCDDVISFYFFN
jgi:hypothetical protein